LPARRLSDAGFAHVARYAALPSIEAPRWLVPLAGGAVAAGALDLYTPYRPKARLQRAALKLALRFGPRFWRPRQVTIATRHVPALLRIAEEALQTGGLQLGVSTGTPGPARKPTVAYLDVRGRIQAYAKVATSDIARSLVVNEAAILGRLAADYGEPRLWPQLLFAGELDGRCVALQSALAGKPASRAMGGGHVQLLARLAGGPPRPVLESDLLRSLGARLAAAGVKGAPWAVLDAALGSLARVELPRTLTHGDFAPWNLRERNGAVTAFDWEYGVLDGLPGLDALHHVLQAGQLLKGWGAAEIHAALQAWTSDVPFGLRFEQARALADVYLLQALAQRLETGNAPDDGLAMRYFAALDLRARTEAVPV
jgi:hypothetical protein